MKLDNIRVDVFFYIKTLNSGKVGFFWRGVYHIRSIILAFGIKIHPFIQHLITLRGRKQKARFLLFILVKQREAAWCFGLLSIICSNSSSFFAAFTPRQHHN